MQNTVFFNELSESTQHEIVGREREITQFLSYFEPLNDTF